MGEYTFYHRCLEQNPLSGIDKKSFLLPDGTDYEGLVFFDTETTGLSGGTGNIVFLIGLGKTDGEHFIVEQYFLSDFPGEGEFLRIIEKNIDTEKIYVSYNGRSFDTNILTTRFLLKGLRFPYLAQLDLLYPARRMWKDVLGSCSLSNIEEKVLGIERENDVLSREVPDIYFHFLRTGETEPLIPVFNHNRRDILSLAELLLRIDTILFDAMEEVSSVSANLAEAGKMLLQQGNTAGIEILERAFRAGDFRAGKFASIYYKRRGNLEAALRIWNIMWRERKSLFAAQELAKYYEHKKREYEKAIEIVTTLLNYYKPLVSSQRDSLKSELLHRLNRLRKKVIALK